jgi:5-(carboxyamino)imidazole ribonucleotide synthase
MIATPLVGTSPSNGPLVAVLGGGQLGRMLGLAGRPLGVAFRFLDPAPDATAGAVGPLLIGALGDAARVQEVARGATVVTYEWEGVPADAARAAAGSAPVRPDPRALEVAQDRLVEKEMFRRLGIEVAPFAPAGDAAGVARAVDAVGLPALAKTRTGGYDGKGQRLLRTGADVDRAWDALGAVPLLVEARVDFERELSVVAVRSAPGETRCWPLVENHHADGILRVSKAPAPGTTLAMEQAAADLAARLLEDLAYVGVLAIELFERDGRLLANELAPRVHNSGHWTIEGAETSQFENHVRAVLGWPLGSTAARGHAAMINCIGALPDRDTVLAIEGAHFHDYEKAPRAGRKVGHVTVTAATAEERDQRLAAVAAVV